MLTQAAHFTIRIDRQLKGRALRKARTKYGVGLGTMTKWFYRSLLEAPEVSVLIGEKVFDEVFDRALQSSKVKKSLAKLAYLTQ